MHLMLLSERWSAKEKTVSVAHNAKLELIARQKAALSASRRRRRGISAPGQNQFCIFSIFNQGGETLALNCRVSSQPCAAVLAPDHLWTQFQSTQWTLYLYVNHNKRCLSRNWIPPQQARWLEKLSSGGGQRAGPSSRGRSCALVKVKGNTKKRRIDRHRSSEIGM